MRGLQFTPEEHIHETPSQLKHRDRLKAFRCAEVSRHGICSSILGCAINHTAKFDTAKKIMVYLYSIRMGDSEKIPRGEMSHGKRLIARRRAIFFCALVLGCLVVAVFFSISCGHTPEQANTPSHDANSLEEQLQKAQMENNWLKEENERLRGEIVRLNQELASASEAIYTLNRKLDAIFNPDITGE